MALERIKRRRRRRRASNLRVEWKYLPNLLTLGRIAAIPLICIFIDNYSPTRSFIATTIYIAISLTDFLDGWLARRRKQVSLLGKYLDPLADKLLVTAVLVYLTAMDRCPAWLVVVLLARELAVQGLRSIATSEGLVIAASSLGKQKTALQLIGTIFLLIHFRYPVWGLETFTIKNEPLYIDYHFVGIYTLYMALVMSVLSAFDYFRLFLRAVFDSTPESRSRPPTASAPSVEAPTPSAPGAPSSGSAA